MPRSEVDLVVSLASPSTGILTVAANKIATVYLRNADGTNGALAVLYTTPNLATTKGNPTTTNGFGQLDAWLDQGSYNVVISGTDITTYTQPWEAMPASAIYNQFKQTVRAVSSTNVLITGPGATIDGVTLVASDRILLTAQTAGGQNGLWVWNAAATALTRPSDFNSTLDSTTVTGTAVFASEGSTNAGTQWMLTTISPITIDTTVQTWVKRVAKFYSTHTWTVGGLLAVASGDTAYIPPMFMSLIAGQTSRIIKARYVLRSGTGTTSVTLNKNGVATSLATLAIPTTTATTTTANISIADGDALAIVVGAIGTTPNNLTFTITVEHTVVV